MVGIRHQKYPGRPRSEANVAVRDSVTVSPGKSCRRRRAQEMHMCNSNNAKNINNRSAFIPVQSTVNKGT